MSELSQAFSEVPQLLTVIRLSEARRLYTVHIFLAAETRIVGDRSTSQTYVYFAAVAPRAAQIAIGDKRSCGGARGSGAWTRKAPLTVHGQLHTYLYELGTGCSEQY